MKSYVLFEIKHPSVEPLITKVGRIETRAQSLALKGTRRVIHDPSLAGVSRRFEAGMSKSVAA